MHLITGTRSGLGRYLQEELKAVGFARGDHVASIRDNMKAPFDSIIHCAFNVNRDITSINLHNYVNDNLLLLQQLLDIPHKKFIFISSADVYPKKAVCWKEEDEFPIESVEGLYGLTKLMAEAMIKNKTKNYLILRPTALLGIHSRPNSLIKILNSDHVSLTLNANSSFNYILHQDVLHFIQKALQCDLCGIFNLAASSPVLLDDVVTTFKRNVQFGSFIYQVANLCNKKATEYCEVFSNTSLDNIKRLLSLMELSSC